MKLSKTLLHTMLVAVTTGTIISCEKASVDDGKKTDVQNPKTQNPKTVNIPEGCPACGMG